ncbi:uncharacterized protein LOC116139556 isoform X1 [Pistacia vera]|uniref:uncharacterized protein LOC116139556 isoform X1 n=3 Tax=Pistacia vera TaxID=55513 RepID=UPI00126398FB|nr:uncharacterized protein LOC116139556 isoform X1 [Pistacia vera]
MASVTATCSPSSLQLRLALNCRNCGNSPAMLIRSRFKKLNHPVRLFCYIPTGGQRRDGNSWIRSNSTGDTFSGWSSSDNDGEKSLESQRKKWFGGIVGAGVAGVVLLAGLFFAALSLSKRSTSRVKPEMELLTAQQEVSLASNNEKVKVDEDGDGDGERDVKLDDNSVESKTGTDNVPSSSEYNEVPSENKIASNTEKLSVDDVNYASSGINVIDNASIQEDLQHESAFHDISVAPDETKLLEPDAVGGSFIAPSLKDSDDSIDACLPESTSEVSKDNLVNVEPTNLSNPTDLSSDHQEGLPGSNVSNVSLDSTSASSAHTPTEPVAVIVSVSSDTILEPEIVPKDLMEAVSSPSSIENLELGEKVQASGERNNSSLEVHNFSESGFSGTASVSESSNPFSNEKETYHQNEIYESSSYSVPPTRSSFSPAGIPAPSVVSAALQVLPGKVLVPAVVDQVQGQALAALQVLKVIEADAQPTDLCTRREYARWLVSASSVLSRNTVSKVYPAMYIDNVSELAFDDITPKDPDFSSIQGLAEAGLISSKLSQRDLFNEDPGPLCFSPESALSRQDLVSWKMALEKRQLPEADRKILHQLSGFIDIDKINPDAWPALIADLSAGEQGIMALAFGCTRLFQPNKPVTKAQAAVAIATGEASDIVSDELARIEAESAAENAVSAHNALIAEVEKDINASFEKELSMERDKIDAVEKMAEEARQELERLKAEREGNRIALMKEHAAIESEMEILSKLRREVEEQLESLMSNKVEISYEKERISKLRIEAENENQEIARLQYELEVERKALSMARSWAEDEAKRAREQAKALEEARDRWEKHGIKVVVDNDLREESVGGVTWLNAGEQFSVEGSVNRAQSLVDKLKGMADEVRGKSKEIIDKIIQKILLFISVVKEWASKAGTRAEELKDAAILKAKGSVHELQQSTVEFKLAVTEGAKRVAGDCRGGVEKLTQRFKT